MVSGGNTDKFPLDLWIQSAKNLPWKEGQPISDKALNFLTQIYNVLDPSSFDQFQQDDVALWARDFWMWSASRPGVGAKIQTRRAVGASGNPLPYSLLEIVGPDMPFLVASVTGACQNLNINPVLVIHPIVDIDRDEDGNRIESGSAVRESCILIVLDLLDDAARKTLENEVRDTLKDIQLSVQDYFAMHGQMKQAAVDVASNQFVSQDKAAEAADFLKWLADEHFIFLGCRHYRFVRKDDGSLAQEEPEIVQGTSLGILRDQDRFILSRGHEPTSITPQISEFLGEPDPIIVSKSSNPSRVHRRVAADYIGVKQYANDGQVIGEIRFTGLFTADAYNRMAREVPLIRRKVSHVISTAGKRPGSHDANALKHILETYPRDELFQMSELDLLDVSLAILQLENRKETRLFVRKDRFNRFISALVFVPKESFNTELRSRIGAILEKAYGGRLTAFYPKLSEAPLARIHFLVDIDQNHPEPDIDELEAEIARVSRSWNDRMRALVRVQRAELSPRLSENLLTDAFNLAYKEAFSPEEALLDIQKFSEISEQRPVALRAFRLPTASAETIRAKIYTYQDPVELSNCVPIFERMGLFVASESGFPVRIGSNGRSWWVHDFLMYSDDRAAIRLKEVGAEFEEAFENVWLNKTENDGFNRLVLAIGASWREAALFRTLARYRKQTGLDPAQTTQIQALCNHTGITRHLLQAFRLRFDPDLELSLDDRAKESAKMQREILAELEKVESLDEDRVLRRLMSLIYAIQRTSFFQLDENGEPLTHIAIKIASGMLEALPDPKPFREIFVCAPHVEGVHLRFGPVARGGLRWSDRRDDFRTEVLGLVKAQQVKNAVIVPVGSKGGFYPKMLPKDGDPESIRAEGIRAYKTFILAMLQLTDNLIDGEPQHPGRTVIWDGADPYLVVAADKGTATFSDIANGISQSLDFWLDDAFASGGSAGYDHKKMGITARGAWVAVQRHFREMGVNVQTDRFSVIGIGDMGGDVFGNGMLLSKTIELKAAFNHLHIFLDPNPEDTEKSWAERKRLFDMPRSSWEDYDPDLISKGGGVFSRKAKSISLTPEIKTFLGVEADSLTSQELMNAILKAEADLMWFGGIGTYVKSTSESHLDVSDKTNDAIRVNADELNVKVVGEGANLGVTQEARINFSRLGGRINTDAIDNSAGVDSSDHEVNIKILLKNAIQSGALKEADRNDLLASMTDEVAELVLHHNYDQTGALSVAEASAEVDLDSHERMMERLEAKSILDRSVEGLPKPEEIRVLHETHQGLTRPELAVLMAYAKITLFDEIVDSDIPDDPFLEGELYAYFPEPLHVYADAMEAHRLRREIIATRLANEMINLGGITFVHRVKERANAETATIAQAFIVAKELFGLTPLLKRIDALDNKIPANVQTSLRIDLINALRRQVFWLAKTRPGNASIEDLVDQYGDGINLLMSCGNEILSPFEQDLLSERIEGYVADGAPQDIAKDVALVLASTSATDIVDLAQQEDKDVRSIALLFAAVGEGFQFDRLRHAALTLELDQHWDRLAVRGIVETLLGQQFMLVSVMSKRMSDERFSNYDAAKSDVEGFLKHHETSYKKFEGLLSEIEQAGAWSFAKLVLIANAIRSFIDESDLRTV